MKNELPVTIDDIRRAQSVLDNYLSPCPLIRSYALEKELRLDRNRRIWIKDYGWSPVGSFKLLGAINWVANLDAQSSNRPVVAHSSGNFASGIAFAGKQFGKRVIVVMPQTAPKIKFELTESFGAEIRTYDIATDHVTGARGRMVREIVEGEDAVQASPYDDKYVIAGNGVGGLEIAEELHRMGRNLSQFVCAVSGGGLMAGHAISIAKYFPSARITGVEPEGADDFRQSLAAGDRIRLSKPQSICDGLLSYDVGVVNWPILRKFVDRSVVVSDSDIREAMRWVHCKHGLRTEPSGAIAIATLLFGKVDASGEGDIVLVLSGRNVDIETFEHYISG